jgi:hypothetical protein
LKDLYTSSFLKFFANKDKTLGSELLVCSLHPWQPDATASRHWDQMPLHRGLELRLCRGLEIGEVAAGQAASNTLIVFGNKETEVAKAVERSCRKTALTKPGTRKDVVSMSFARG